MEGLTALVRKSVFMGDFKHFNYGVEEKVDILQFADDTIILAEPSSDNLWHLKALLRGFEFVSGLKTNFSKSYACGVNIGDWFMNSATSFLACKKGDISFLFLEILVGANPRRRKVWVKVINNIKGRLSSWKGRNISIGGRVTLINVILNAIPSFHLSFYKAPGVVLKEIRSILSNFLWSGNVSKRSIHWVNWETVCKPKDKGGLGVRDVREINKELLLKWKWRILKEDKAIWCNFLDLRYNGSKLKVQKSRGFLLLSQFSDLYEFSTNKLCTVSAAFSRDNDATFWHSTVSMV
ncbi:uncharacterized protein LOC131648283 [Vicia villosa]|uniref:uncharacterized protein LOC131648283 n=1 Tax=Vicia villosa TaxID=3911 RepID=UPI00273BE1A5|nr:uncharacterized protein LOC131648283 [Vicia villosa]